MRPFSHPFPASDCCPVCRGVTHPEWVEPAGWQLPWFACLRPLPAWGGADLCECAVGDTARPHTTRSLLILCQCLPVRQRQVSPPWIYLYSGPNNVREIEKGGHFVVKSWTIFFHGKRLEKVTQSEKIAQRKREKKIEKWYCSIWLYSFKRCKRN